MSQATELLNGVAEERLATSDSSEPHIVIGRDRFITVPTELKRIAVQGDHNVETVTFDCPRYWDGHDLSTMRVYVNYVRPDGKPGSFPAGNIVVDDADSNLFHFTWTVSANVTEVKGKIRFMVCAKRSDENGVETNHWNSEVNNDLYVSEGLVCVDIASEIEPDIVEYILSKIDATPHLTRLPYNRYNPPVVGDIFRLDLTGKAEPCEDGEDFHGVCVEITSDAPEYTMLGQMDGPVWISFTGPTPTAGYVKLSANGAGGVKIDTSGREYFVQEFSRDAGKILIRF